MTSRQARIAANPERKSKSACWERGPFVSTHLSKIKAACGAGDPNKAQGEALAKPWEHGKPWEHERTSDGACGAGDRHEEVYRPLCGLEIIIHGTPRVSP